MLARLPPAQQVQYHSIRSTKRQQQYLYSRLLIVTALSHYYRRPTDSWQLEEQSSSPLTILNLPEPGFVSLSHSQNLICFTLAPGRIGVDCEQMKDKRNFRSMAELFMSKEEQRLLPDNEDELKRYFYRLWCAKEAHYKALPASTQSETAFSALSYQTLKQHRSTWQLFETEIEDYQVAIVTEKTTANATVMAEKIDLT